MSRILNRVVLFACACCFPVVATPVFTLSFDTPTVTLAPGDSYTIDATITNTGSTTIDYLQYYSIGSPTKDALASQVSTYSNGNDVYNEFNNVSITPGQSFDFAYLSFTLNSNATPGSYVAFDPSAVYFVFSDDLNESNAPVNSSNNVTVTIADSVPAIAPEPASWMTILLSSPLLLWLVLRKLGMRRIPARKGV